MFSPLRIFLVGLLAIGLVAPQFALAQETQENEEETVIETEDGRRVVIREGDEDTDGDRPQIERRVIRREAPAHRMRNRRFRGDRLHAERRGEIVIRDEDGNERRFSMDGDAMRWHGEGDVAVTDTTIDGNQVLIIRTPDGNEEIIEMDGMSQNDFAFRMRDFDMPGFEQDFEIGMPENHEMRLRMFGHEDGDRFAFGPNFMRLEGMMGSSPELRREMMELEHRSTEIASQLREEQNDELENELDDVLNRLFQLRGEARAERADRIERHAEELREEAQELRESLSDRNRERQEIIEERKQELLGRSGGGW